MPVSPSGDPDGLFRVQRIFNMTKKAALKAATASILVAAVTLSLGRDKETGERNRLGKDEELTADLAEAFGLSSKDVQSLVDDGKLVEKQVRAAASTGGADGAALAAAIQRADDAEKDYADLEKHVETLEKQIAEQGEQIEKLTTDLAEATKPAADAGKGGKA